MNYSEFVNTALGTLGIAVLLGACVLVFKNSANNTRMKDYQTQVDSLSQWNRDLTDRVNQLEKSDGVKQEKINSLEKENSYLKELVSQRAPFEQLIQKLDSIERLLMAVLTPTTNVS